MPNIIFSAALALPLFAAGAYCVVNRVTYARGGMKRMDPILFKLICVLGIATLAAGVILLLGPTMFAFF